MNEIILCRYSFKDKKVKAIFTEKVMFGKLLQYLRGGQQVATLEHEDFDQDYQKVSFSFLLGLIQAHFSYDYYDISK